MKKNIMIYSTAFFIVLLSIAGFAQETSQTSPFHGFPELIEDWMSKWRIPGMAIGVVRDGEIIYMQGFGYRDLENKLPVTTKTVFGIGSISRSFTSMSVAMLVDEAKLKMAPRPVRWGKNDPAPPPEPGARVHAHARTSRRSCLARPASGGGRRRASSTPTIPSDIGNRVHLFS